MRFKEFYKRYKGVFNIKNYLKYKKRKTKAKGEKP